MGKEGKMGTGKTCNCMHHKVLPWLTILIGLDFLLGAANVLTPAFVSFSWPIILIVAGFCWMKQSSCTCC